MLFSIILFYFIFHSAWWSSVCLSVCLWWRLIGSWRRDSCVVPCEYSSGPFSYLLTWTSWVSIPASPSLSLSLNNPRSLSVLSPWEQLNQVLRACLLLSAFTALFFFFFFSFLVVSIHPWSLLSIPPCLSFRPTRPFSFPASVSTRLFFPKFSVLYCGNSPSTVRS